MNEGKEGVKERVNGFEEKKGKRRVRYGLKCIDRFFRYNLEQGLYMHLKHN